LRDTRGFREPQVDRATVWFRRIPEAVIDEVIPRGEVFAHAGGFSITDPPLEAYIERVDGTAESVIGLPTALTRRLMDAVLSTYSRWCHDEAERWEGCTALGL